MHDIKEERQKIAYMRFETEPGYQSQVDFGEFQFVRADGTIGKIYLFSMILGFSRRLYCEFVDRCDLPTFLDCHIRAFDYFGGVTEEILYDRMKNVFIRKLAGKDKFNDTLMGFALHYGFKPQVAPPYAAWVKGKVERPYHFIREGFWRGYGYTSNKAFSDWTELFQDPVIVTAFLDRLLHHSVVINVRGNSYRLRGKVVNEGMGTSLSGGQGGSLFTTENGSLRKDR